jgi:2-oxoisovalerate dehydrogenase E1 component alpha subunit
MNLAAIDKAPCVFFVQNNQWAISVPLHKQTAAPSIAHKAIGYGMPGIRVDGNDVLACYAVMAEAAARARAGGGPTLIEAVTYRLGPHTTSDDPSRYRTQEEVDRWTLLDPIPRYRTYLQGQGLWSNRLEDRVAARSKRMRAELRDAVSGAPDFDIDEVFTAVYAEMTPGLQAQRDALRAELDRSDAEA